MHTTKINNNISLHYIEMKKLKTTTVGVYIRRKIDKNEASYNAVLPYVLKNGCKKYPSAKHITQQLQNLYGASLNSGVIKYGDNQIIFFDSETISDKYTPDNEKLISSLVELLLSVIFEPLCDNSRFIRDITEREKNTVKNKIEALINDKRNYAQLRCTQELCKGDPFEVSKYGDITQIDEINEENLYAHYKNIITNSRIDIFAVGEADTDELAKQISEYVKGFEFTDFEPVETGIIKSLSEKKNVTESLDVTQGKLAIGFTTSICAKDPDYPALVVANSIYGSGTHSKLFNNVREKLSLAYYASSAINKHKGIMIVNAGIEFDNFQKAYGETLLQLNELKKGNISDEEITFSKNSLIDELNSYSDDQRYMQLYTLECLYLGISYDLDGYKERINAVTKEDVVRVANKINENVVYFLKGNERNERK